MLEQDVVYIGKDCEGGDGFVRIDGVEYRAPSALEPSAVHGLARGRGRTASGRLAAAAVTTQMVQDTALIGPLGKIKDELQEWKRTALTTMLVGGSTETLRTISELVLA